MWIWDGGFRAHERNEDGTITEKVFTSAAQARQHVEQQEDVVLAKRSKPPKRGQHRQRKSGMSYPAPGTKFKFPVVKDVTPKVFLKSFLVKTAGIIK
jgi:hypothetical protein